MNQNFKTIDHGTAKGTLYALVEHVLSSPGMPTGVTYKDLATFIGRTFKRAPLTMGKPLSDMGKHLKVFSEQWEEDIPCIQSLAINKQTGMPGKGIKEFWPDYPQLTPEQKLKKVRSEYNKINNFGIHWNKLLVAFDLEPIKPILSKSQSPTRKFSSGKGGESSAHKNLKKYVRDHPEIVGASSEYDAFIEYPFPSQDTVDVLFKSHDCWVAVEVKSRVSDRVLGDYTRGLYQCVKYRALIEAMRKAKYCAVPEKIRAVLVLERNFPHKHRKTAESLNVKVIDGIVVPEESN